MAKIKAFAVITVARQVEGEYVAVKVEKAYTKASKADEYAKGLASKYAETIQTAGGPVPCVCERGVFEIEIDD